MPFARGRSLRMATKRRKRESAGGRGKTVEQDLGADVDHGRGAQDSARADASVGVRGRIWMGGLTATAITRPRQAAESDPWGPEPASQREHEGDHDRDHDLWRTKKPSVPNSRVPNRVEVMGNRSIAAHIAPIPIPMPAARAIPGSSAAAIPNTAPTNMAGKTGPPRNALSERP